MRNIFNIKGYRKSQKTISNQEARNLVKHIMTKDTSDDYIYGKNGEIRGWVLGALTQLGKDKPWNEGNRKGYKS